MKAKAQPVLTGQYPTGDWDLLPPAWKTSGATYQNVITWYRLRLPQPVARTIGPVHEVEGVATYTVSWTEYDEAEQATFSAQGSATLSGSTWTYTW